MEEFKIGDKVRRVGCNFGKMRVGDEGVIVRIGMSNELYFDGDNTGYDKDYFKLVLRNGKKPKPDDFVRYMVYGFGCDNKTELYDDEKKMSTRAREVVKDDSWTGKVIGYKLIPLFEIEKKTILKKFKVKK